MLGDPHATELVLEAMGVIRRKEPTIRIEQNVRVESLEEILRTGQKVVMAEPQRHSDQNETTIRTINAAQRPEIRD